METELDSSQSHNPALDSGQSSAVNAESYASCSAGCIAGIFIVGRIFFVVAIIVAIKIGLNYLTEHLVNNVLMHVYAYY